jgi:hypothetical protein
LARPTCDNDFREARVRQRRSARQTYPCGSTGD